MSCHLASRVVLLVSVATLLSACATVTPGSRWARTVKTEPAGARVDTSPGFSWDQTRSATVAPAPVGPPPPKDAHTALTPAQPPRPGVHVWNETIDPPARPAPPPPDSKVVIVGAPSQK